MQQLLAAAEAHEGSLCVQTPCHPSSMHQSCRMLCCCVCVARAAVRLLREELQLLQEPGSYVGEVIKVGQRTRPGQLYCCTRA